MVAKVHAINTSIQVHATYNIVFWFNELKLLWFEDVNIIEAEIVPTAILGLKFYEP